MAELNPPGWLQNAGSTHTAEQMRSYIGALMAGNSGGATSLKPRAGVHPSLGGELFVQQTGSPSMAVDVLSGAAWIPGSEGSKQGAYGVLNDATKTVSIAASHATLNRIDLIVYKVEDSQYSGVNNTSSIVAVTGTAASSPSPPSAPNNSIILAQIAVNANVSSITNANITDKRPFIAAVGGVIKCTTTSRPATADVLDGQLLWVDDLDRFEFALGSAFVPLSIQNRIFKLKTADQSIASQTTPQNDNHLFASVEANATYTFRLNLLHQVSGSIVDIGTRFTFPAGSTLHFTAFGPDAALQNSTFSEVGRWIADSTSTTPTSGFIFGSNGMGIGTRWEGVLVVGGSAGTFQFQWAQGASNATAVTVKAGSFLELIRAA